jgi:hypothetical protein
VIVCTKEGNAGKSSYPHIPTHRHYDVAGGKHSIYNIVLPGVSIDGIKIVHTGVNGIDIIKRNMIGGSK